jgi:hypothetical protein
VTRAVRGRAMKRERADERDGDERMRCDIASAVPSANLAYFLRFRLRGGCQPS